MVGLVPTIHVFASLIERGVQDVDARHEGEHDGWGQRSKFHSRPAGRFGLPCGLIIGHRTEATGDKVRLNEMLRDFGSSLG